MAVLQRGHALAVGVCATLSLLFHPFTRRHSFDIYIAWSLFLYVAHNPFSSSVEYAAKNGHVDNLASLCRDCGLLG